MGKHKNKTSEEYWKLQAEAVYQQKEDPATPEMWLPPSDGPDIIDTPQFWEPALNPTQKLIFNDPKMVVIAYGEKGSGKSMATANAGVRHCYENANALWIVIATLIATGAEGFLYLLESRVLPVWKYGNKHPEWLENGERNPMAGELMDDGIGLFYEPTRLDPLTKDRHIWVMARDGGWSKILLKSVPHARQVMSRMFGPEPSRIHVEELTHCEGTEYFDHTSIQLNRRPTIMGPQQWTASCNPAGKKNWVYERLVSQARDENGVPHPHISVYHVPITENLKHLNPAYQKQLNLSIRDPYQRRRLLGGEWIDTPDGEAIFKDYFAFDIHVKGKAEKGLGTVPRPGFPILVGHDPGPKNYSLHMMQRIPTTDNDRPLIYNVFDELNFVGLYAPYRVVVRALTKRMKYWIEHPSSAVKYPYMFWHVMDEAAITAKNSKGSTDALDVQRLLKANGFPTKIKGCTKGIDSVPQRVQMLVDLLLYECIYISALLPDTLDMLRLLPSKELKEGEYDPFAGLRPTKCTYLHPFDSLTYPIWRNHVRPGRATRVEAEQPNRVFWAGHG